MAGPAWDLSKFLRCHRALDSQLATISLLGLVQTGDNVRSVEAIACDACQVQNILYTQPRAWKDWLALSPSGVASKAPRFLPAAGRS
jgi:hypothetical protein